MRKEGAEVEGVGEVIWPCVWVLERKLAVGEPR